MEVPFVFGKLATGKNFTDREEELQHLTQNFISGTNTILISPRRWGKSSLVKKAGDKVVGLDDKIRVVYMDMYNIRSEEEFYKSLSMAVLSAVSNKIQDIIDNSKKFLKQWIPRITFSPDQQQEISLALDWEEVKKQPDEILNLAEAISINKGVQIIICIDEFQNISSFKEPLVFQKKLRSHWQKHQKTAYCIYGSKRHMLLDVFTSPSMPFYKFGDLFFLEKIQTTYWKDFIQKRFKSTGKKISKKNAGQIAESVENHPYYVQQLAHLCWFRTSLVLDEKHIKEALESLVLQLSLLFQGLTETLTNTQINFLKAILDEVEQISSKKTIDEYKLGTSANVYRIKQALINKEVLDEKIHGKLELIDPVYKIWLKEYYF